MTAMCVFTTSKPDNDNNSNGNSGDIRRAINGMSEALDKQQSAANAFRESIGSLKTEIEDLQATILNYQSILDNLDARRLGRKSRRLARLADNWSAL